MAFTYVTISHVFETAADVAAEGTVEFIPVTPMHNGITVVQKTVSAPLAASGAMSQILAANTDPDTRPTGTTYQVVERLKGQKPLTYFVQIPHDLGAAIDLRDLAGWQGGTGAAVVATINGEGPNLVGNVAVSASDVGAQPLTAALTRIAGPVVTLTAVGGVITPDGDAGNVFRHVATADVTLAEPINGDDGQSIDVRVYASGANRVLTFAGAGDVTIPNGGWWWGQFTYDAASTTWIISDDSGGDVGGGGGAVASVNGQTGVVVLDADDLADGSTRVQMTTTERTKLTGVATGATANATNAQLRDRTTHTGVQTINTLDTTGTPSTSTYLRGDGSWSTPPTGGGSGGYATVQDEGSSITQRAILNFTGAGVTVSDNAGSTRTTVNIPGGGSSSSGVPTVINVKADYGAVGNGSTNDATSIQNAINAAEAAGGGRVYFPAGTYNVGSTLVVDNDMVHLVGAGMGVTTLAKTGNFDLLRIAGTAGTGGHTTSCSVRDMMLLGNDFTGRLLDVIYGTRHTFDNLHLFANVGIGIDMVELWDSRFTNCYVEWCSGTSTSEPGIYVRSSRAASGTGSSTDSTNQVYFIGCLVETWRGGAIRVEEGTGSPENIYSIHFYNTKIETDLIRGSAINVGNGASNISFVDTYCYMGSFDSGFSTPVDAISIGGNGQVTVDGCYIGSGDVVLASGVNASGGGVRLNNIDGYYAAGAPTSGSHIRFTGGTNYTLGHISSTNATNLVSGLSTSVQANSINPIRAVAGAVSDASFPAVPPIGTQAVDTSNNRLYVRTASGTWRYASLT